MQHFGPQLASDRRGQRKNMVAQEAHYSNAEEAKEETLNGKRNVTGLLAGHQRSVGASKFDGNVSRRVASTHNENFAGLQLGWIAVVRRVKLFDGWIESSCEARRARFLVVGHRDDHIFRFELLGPGGNAKTIPAARNAVDAYACSNRQVETPRIGFQVVSHLQLGREGVAARGKTKSGKPCVTRRREQAERIPAIAPGVADTTAGIQNQEADAAAGEMVSDGEACLAAADHDGVDAFKSVCLHVEFLPI